MTPQQWVAQWFTNMVFVGYGWGYGFIFPVLVVAGGVRLLAAITKKGR